MLGCGHESPTGFMAGHQKPSVCVCDNSPPHPLQALGKAFCTVGSHNRWTTAFIDADAFSRSQIACASFLQAAWHALNHTHARTRIHTSNEAWYIIRSSHTWVRMPNKIREDTREGINNEEKKKEQCLQTDLFCSPGVQLFKLPDILSRTADIYSIHWKWSCSRGYCRSSTLRAAIPH